MISTEGVVQDFGTPGAPAVDAQGNPVQRKYELKFTCDTEADVMGFIKDAKIRGDANTAQRLEQLIGKRVDPGFFAKHPVVTGVAIGAVVTGAVVGGVIVGRKIYQKRQLNKLQPSGRKLRSVG